MPSLQPESLKELKFISDAVLSADASRAAAVHTVIKEEKDEAPYYQSSIYLYDFKSSKRLSEQYLSDSQPRFSPDGKYMAFLRRNKDEKNQVWLIDLSGGEARKISNLKSGVNSFVWHPNSKQIALVSRGDWENEVAKKGLPFVADRLQYKFNGIGLVPEKMAEIFMLNIKTKKTKSIAKPASNPNQLEFDKAGDSLYFIASESIADVDNWYSNIIKLDLKSLKTKAVLKKPTYLSYFSISPDGKQIAFVSNISESFASPHGLFLINSSGSKAELLTGEYEMGSSPNGDSHYGVYDNSPKWLNQETILANLNFHGSSNLVKINIKSKEINKLDEEKRAISAFDTQNGKIVFIAETPQRPAELFLKDGDKEKRLSKLNDRFVKKYSLDNATDEIIIKKRNQPDISYWKLEPKNPRKDKAIVLEVHGGPHTNYGYGFFHEFHMLAAKGFTVVYGNPRSSSSYGLDFATTVLGRYGTVDADDVMAIAKHALKNHSDSKAPVHLTGGSYGGFMTNWLVGQNNFFSSAVSQRSISNWLSFFGSSDIGYRFATTEVAGNPWNDTDSLWQQSPLKYVKAVRTPILMMHSEEDLRCPIEQAEQFYIAIKFLGKADTSFIRYPDENHELSRSGRPDRRIHRLKSTIGWFEKYGK